MEDVRAKAASVICRQGGVEEELYAELEMVLAKSPSMSEAINLRDSCGYSLLQLAIINNQPNIVKYLITQGGEINIPICGRPLHLAAKLGYVDIVRLLLQYGADPQVIGCVCYPQHHTTPARAVYNADIECWTLVCPGDLYNQQNAETVQFDFPLYYAILSDNVDCMIKILDSGSQDINSESSPLHISCREGSYECMKHFTQINREIVNKVDNSGYTPIQYAIKWGKKFAEYLICNGASVMVKTPRNETLLHLLLKESKVSEMDKKLLSFFKPSKPGPQSRALCGTVCIINIYSTLLNCPIVSLLILFYFILFSNVFFLYFST